MLVKAVAPYNYTDILNFKTYAYKSWEKIGGAVARPHYPNRLLHSIFFRHSFPQLWNSKKEARLRFVSGHSICFDTFPDYLYYEIIPIVWDCWPSEIEKVSSFCNKYRVKTIFFTSSQMTDLFHEMFPNMNVFHITEGIDLDLFFKGEELEKREIDVLEIGRKNGIFFKSPLPDKLNHIKTGNFNRVFKSDIDYRMALANTKVTINVPRCDVDKKRAGNIETLTQRYWECMMSRVVMVGRAPGELIELIGYNPVIDWDGKDAASLVLDILQNVRDYQKIVDHNYETALKMASWDIRMRKIKDILSDKGYIV